MKAKIIGSGRFGNTIIKTVAFEFSPDEAKDVSDNSAIEACYVDLPLESVPEADVLKVSGLLPDILHQKLRNYASKAKATSLFDAICKLIEKIED